MVIYPESFSVKPETEATVGLRNLFNTASQTAVHKNLTLPNGKYVFLSKNADVREMYISNTISEEEYKNAGLTPNIHKTAVVIENVKNMEIDCNDSTFIMNGKMTHILIKNCENITLKNLTIENLLPNIHKITVVKATPFYVTFKIGDEGVFKEENGKYYWYGTDYKFGLTELEKTASWMPTARPDNFNHIKRAPHHPLYGAASMRPVGERTFSVRFILPKDYEVGQVFYMYPALREEVGILIDSSIGIKLENIKQSFNYSLAVVAQNSANITVENVDFSPREDAETDFTSLADFFQFSMCRGKVAVRNSNFSSAGDDACNVHGFHFKITESEKDKITVKFCHPQSYGFECIHDGDTIAFIDPKTLIEVGRTKVLHAQLRDKYYYDITMASYEAPIGVGGVIENISACPDFEFSGNTVNRVVTRGVLATTRGKIRIENNKFLNTGMSGILISDDATSWYESGCVSDVVIRGNAFMNCEENAILIKPENRKYDGPVHRNILIENNLFVLNGIYALNASSSSGITMKGNTYAGEPKDDNWVVTHKVDDFICDCPKK